MSVVLHIIAPLTMIALLFPSHRLRREGWSQSIFNYLFDATIVGIGTSFILWICG